MIYTVHVSKSIFLVISLPVKWVYEQNSYGDMAGICQKLWVAYCKG